MKQVVFTIGRMNPPTLGHARLLRAAKDLCRTVGADYRFHVTKTQDGKSNPLDLATKMKFLKIFFPNTEFVATLNAFTACREMAQMGYEKGVLVVGSDRDGDLINGLRNYIGHDDPAKSIGLKALDSYVVERNDGDVSATSARVRARDEDFEGFCALVPKATPEQLKELYDAVRKGLGK